MNDDGKNKELKTFVSGDNKGNMDFWYRRYIEAIKIARSVENKSTSPLSNNHIIYRL